mmetsp:Transcript_12485/g.12569  ORF Transcript_12485/g.12569 Transcript_12485/m.12569 type:complete len:181 (-) Transcript_12485:274-816(-)
MSKCLPENTGLSYITDRNSSLPGDRNHFSLIELGSYPLSQRDNSCWSVTVPYMNGQALMAGITDVAENTSNGYGHHYVIYAYDSNGSIMKGEEYQERERDYWEWPLILNTNGKTIFLYNPLEHTLSAYDTYFDIVECISNIPFSPNYKVMVLLSDNASVKIEAATFDERNRIRQKIHNHI